MKKELSLRKIKKRAQSQMKLIGLGRAGEPWVTKIVWDSISRPLYSRAVQRDLDKDTFVGGEFLVTTGGPEEGRHSLDGDVGNMTELKRWLLGLN